MRSLKPKWRTAVHRSPVDRLELRTYSLAAPSTRPDDVATQQSDTTRMAARADGRQDLAFQRIRLDNQEHDLRDLVTRPSDSIHRFKIQDYYDESSSSRLLPPHIRRRTSETLSSLHLAKSNPESSNLRLQLSGLIERMNPDFLEEDEKTYLTRVLRMSGSSWNEGIEFPQRGPWDVTQQDVKGAESTFLRALPNLSGQGDTGKRLILAHINHILHLTARLPSEKMFSQVLTLFPQYGLQPDSYTDLAQILLWSRTDNRSRLPLFWRQLVAKAQPESAVRGDLIILLNAILWAFASQAEWDTVGVIYNQLLTNVRENFPGKNALSARPAAKFPEKSFLSSTSLPVPASLIPSKTSYQSLINALAFYGDLDTALAVLQDMMSDPRDFQPEASDLVALIHGFAEYGQGAVEELRRADWLEGVVPHFSDRQRKLVPREKELGEAKQAKRTTLREIGKSWMDTINHWDHKSNHNAPATPNEWSPGVFDTLFASLLAVAKRSPVRSPTNPKGSISTPLVKESQAPNSRALFQILIAFVRVHGPDPMGLEMIWLDLERKFGPGNAEGWSGWAVDSRLRRLRAAWMKELNAR